jgi:hypothetical protein
MSIIGHLPSLYGSRMGPTKLGAIVDHTGRYLPTVHHDLNVYFVYVLIGDCDAQFEWICFPAIF